MKKYTHTFISALVEKDYKKANNSLKRIINEKIKQKIINNNVKIF